MKHVSSLIALMVLWVMSPQVHGAGTARPTYLDADVELIHGDVRDERAVAAALNGIDAVFVFSVDSPVTDPACRTV